MYASAWPSDGISGAGAPARQRAEASVALTVARFGATSRATRIAERGSARLRLPKGQGPALEAVFINTGGGVACGDRFDVEAVVEQGAALSLATSAAEKIYRSDGPVARITLRMTIAEGAAAEWLPQETILFDCARLERRFEIDLDADARFLAFEVLQFGRQARGETVREGLVADRWRIRRRGRLVYADSLRLDGPITDLLNRPTIGGGARVLATFLYAASDAEARLDQVRTILEPLACEAAASAWNGILAVRFIADKLDRLRCDAVSFLTAFRGAPMPRVWQT